MNIIVEDFVQHGRDPFAWGFWALLIYRLGSARTRFESPYVRKPWGAAHYIAVKFAELMFGISIGINAKIGRRLTIEHFGCIIVHNCVVIGDDVTIRQGVTLGNRRLAAPLDAPIIGSRVNIGAGAKVLGRITIGDDVAIGANAVVLEDVPSGCVAVGVPAVIKKKALGRVRTS
jgi:serine O-acetyltransferase